MARRSTPSAEPPRRYGLIYAAATFAAAEFLSTLLIGRFFEWGRAEALLFHAFRPWLLLVAAVWAAPLDWRSRASLYIGGISLAGVAESAFLAMLGADYWVVPLLRGVLAAAVLTLAIDLLVQAGRRLMGRYGKWAAAIACAAAFLLGALKPYEAILLAPLAQPSAERKPDLLLMTALPIIWGEKGAFDPSSKPAEAYLLLQEEFAVQPVDVLDPATLRRRSLLLLAQPRLLAPEELVALDTWVRRGGRALILTDPLLVWPSGFGLGDTRRPPPVSWLGPLLDHWGLKLETPQRARVEILDLRPSERRLAMAAPGRFMAEGTDCRIGMSGRAAHCRIGEGRVLLIADADLLRDQLWMADMPSGAERHARLADNPLLIADWLDHLSGRARKRVGGAVDWLDRRTERAPAVAAALLLLAMGFAAGWAAHRVSVR